MTLKNVPPGTYQFIVDLYGKETTYAVAKGHPIIEVQLGAGAAVSFECRIPPECEHQGASLWAPFDIKISEDGEEEGKRRYKIRIKDEKESIQPIESVSLPTGNNV